MRFVLMRGLCARLFGWLASAATIVNGGFELGTNPGSYATVGTGGRTSPVGT